ncbi:MAG: hypothetical protein JNK72_14990 [Myxococcales bacterium]|nr:hypothetical protein [Myxococcales bacterium]
MTTPASLTAETLMARWFWPLYPPDVRDAPFLHRDVDANPGQNPALYQQLTAIAEQFTQNAEALLGAPLSLDDAGVATLAQRLDRARRDRWMAESAPGDPRGVFFNAVIHAACFLGEVMVRRHGGRWELRRPLWESVVHRPSGGAVSPFHWLLKGLADDAVDAHPLAVRWRLHVLQPNRDPRDLATVTSAKSLPKLKEPTYDLFVKYLHTHLPGLRDVGEGFPSAQAFTEKRYAVLSFTPMASGRLLALHGQTHSTDAQPGVVEIHWLTAEGHDHTDSIPSDHGVPYFARAVTDEILEVTVGWQKKPHTHRLTFRGHA